MSERTRRKTGGSGNVVLQQYTEMFMDGTSNQHVCLKENCIRRKTYAEKWKETAGNPWIDNKEKVLEKPDLHGAYCKQE